MKSFLLEDGQIQINSGFLISEISSVSGGNEYQMYLYLDYLII